MGIFRFFSRFMGRRVEVEDVGVGGRFWFSYVYFVWEVERVVDKIIGLVWLDR